MSTLQELVNAGRPGDTVTIPPGVYPTEERVTAPAGVTVLAHGAILRSRDSLLTSGKTKGQIRARDHYRPGSGGAVIGLTVDGPAPLIADAPPGVVKAAPRYVAAAEAQHGINVIGDVVDARVIDCTVRNVYGDGIYIGEGPVDKTGRGAVPKRITIDGCTITDVARQGFAAAVGDDVVFRNTTIDGVGRSSIDLEPNGKAKGMNRVLVENVDLRRRRNYTIAAAGQGFLNDVTIRNVTCDYFSVTVSTEDYEISGPGVDRYRWLFHNITAEQTSAPGPGALVVLSNAHDFTFMSLDLGPQTKLVKVPRGPFPWPTYVVRCGTDCTGIVVEGVDWPTGWGAISPLSTAGRTAHNAPFEGRPAWDEVTPEAPDAPTLVGELVPVALPALPVNA